MTAGGARLAAQRLGAWAARLGPGPILLAGWLAFLIYAYPGYMSSDSIDQLLDARIGTFNDWHSPTMTELWRWVGLAISGPFGMLALQSLLLLGGGYALAARRLPPRTAALVASGALVFPPVMSTMAVIWQDSQMAGFLLAGLAAITSRRRGMLACGLGLFVLASAMRPSAPIAVLPLLVLGLAARGERPVSWRRHAVAVVAWAAVWLAAVGLDAGLRSTATGHARTELAIADLIGTLRYAGRLDDAAVRALVPDLALRGADLQARASVDNARRRDPTDGPDRLFEPPASAADRDALLAAQHRLAAARPRAYLLHRWHILYRVLGAQTLPGEKPVYTEFAGSAAQADAAVHLAQHSAVQGAAIAVVEALARTPLFWPFVYAAIAVALLVLAARRRQAVPAALAASGLAYELSLFVVAPTSSYALSHWMIASTTLAGALIAVAAVRAWRDSARVAPALASHPPEPG